MPLGSLGDSAVEDLEVFLGVIPAGIVSLELADGLLEFDPLRASFVQILNCQFLIGIVTSGAGVRLEDLLRGLRSITVADLAAILGALAATMGGGH